MCRWILRRSLRPSSSSARGKKIRRFKIQHVWTFTSWMISFAATRWFHSQWSMRWRISWRNHDLVPNDLQNFKRVRRRHLRLRKQKSNRGWKQNKIHDRNQVSWISDIVPIIWWIPGSRNSSHPSGWLFVKWWIIYYHIPPSTTPWLIVFTLSCISIQKQQNWLAVIYDPSKRFQGHFLNLIGNNIM